MKKRNLVFGAILLIALILVFFAKSLSLKEIIKGKTADKEISQTTVAHQSHTEKDSIQQTASTEKPLEEPPVVEIPLEKQQFIGVKTTTVQMKSVQKSLATVGRIEYDEKKLATINSKVEGWIEKLYVDYTGKYINRGEPLAEIYSPELLATQQEFINLLKWKKSAELRTTNTELKSMLTKDTDSIIEAAKQRLRLWDITDEQIRKIEETGKPMRTLTLYSPVSGFVVQKAVFQGMRIMPGEKLLDVADMSTVWVIADVYEYQLPLIDVGQEAEITLSYLPGRIFKSKIEFVYPSLSSDTRTAKIRFSLPNNDHSLKPQMYTNIAIKRSLGKRLIIPDDAIIDTGKRQIVYVDKGDGFFEPREVVAGLRADGAVEIIKGLKAGEKVASSGNFLIDSEARLKGIIK